MNVITSWYGRSIVVGSVIWLIGWSVYLGERNFFSEVELLLIGGIGLVVPLAIQLAWQPDRNGHVPRVYELFTRLLPLAVVAVGAALLLESSPLAAMLAAVWLIQTLLLAIYGLVRLLPRPVLAIEEICIDLGLLYSPVSGVWLVAYAADYNLLTFDKTFVLLTATHFTFISLGALVIAGMIGRQLYATPAWGAYRRLAWLAVVSPALVAAGITTTQFSGVVVLEAGAVVLLAGSFLMLSFLFLFNALPQSNITRWLLRLSAGSLLITMGFALAYSGGRLTNWWAISLTDMVRWHGWFNAIAFVFLGLVAWNIAPAVSHVAVPGIPFSVLPWRWRIGPDFFERIDAIDTENVAPPTGTIDHMKDFACDDFDPSTIAPTIAAVYENILAHEMAVYAEWHRGFGIMAHIFRRLAKRIGQVNFPHHSETQQSSISSKMMPLKDSMDGRERVRGWVRSNSDTGEAIYVSAYATHQYQGCTYMNVALPFPLGNIANILRPQTMSGNSGDLLLTSISQRDGDQGIYLVTRFLTIRLPINETFHMFLTDVAPETWPRAFDKGEVLAEHKIWLFGMHFLTLYYSITAKNETTEI